MRSFGTLIFAVVALLGVSQSAFATLLHYVPFEEGAGGTTVNFGTAGGLATINNDATGGLGIGGNAWILNDPVRGTVLSGNDNNGTSAFTTTSGVSAATYNGNWTQTIWAAVTGTGNDVVLGNRFGSSGGFTKLDTNNFEWRPAGGTNIGSGTGTGSETDWNQFTITKNGTTFSVYRDGVLQNTATNGGTFTPQILPYNIFGDGGERPGGRVDEVGFFLEAQSAGEVAAMFNLNDRSQAAGYNLLEIDGIFGVFNDGGTFATDDGLLWSQASGLAGGLGTLIDNGGSFAIQLDGQGRGVVGANPIPEPTTGLLAALGLMSMAGIRRRRNA